MEFKEENCYTYIPKGDCFIYFLLDNNDVVYIGKTNKGLYRPLSHKDKKFDTVKILYCDENNLSVIEGNFICKYKPKYNKVMGSSSLYSLLKSRNIIRKNLNINNFTINDLKKTIKQLNLNVEYFNCKSYLRSSDLECIIKYLNLKLNKSGTRMELQECE